MGTEMIKNAYKIKIGRHRTQVTTYENMQLQTTQPIKKDKPKKIKPNIPSDYAKFNYYNRMKQRRRILTELCFNNFAIPNVSMLTLTFDQKQSTEKSYTDIKVTHQEFKKFIQRVNSHYQDFMYIATFSRQSNGNWHYHIICNFPHNIVKAEISQLWGNGMTHITYINTTGLFDTSIKYLIDNLNEASGELNKKHGYLYSKQLEKDKEITSWRVEHDTEFEEAFERVNNSSRSILYKTRNHIGIRGEHVNEETGEIFEVTIHDKEINDTLRNAGYESLDTVYTHLSSAADFSDKFKELKPATPIPRKFKRVNIAPEH